jgi:hypothetical protein
VVDPRGSARFARMAGSSIAGHDAAAWATHFLNAAYYAAPMQDRDLYDLRFALAVLTTFWHRRGNRPLGARDVPEFHQSFRRGRAPGGSRYPRGRLDRAQLRSGAVELLGDWFLDAYKDPDRRGWGIVFESTAERDAYQPETRLRNAQLAALSPPRAPVTDQVWHSYDPVEIPSIEDLVSVLGATAAWSDYATEIGRFTALRGNGLHAGQTFEIEVVAELANHAPMFTRGYVTVSRVLDRSTPQELSDYVAALNDSLAQYGHEQPVALAAGANPAHVIELTTHEGHFLGRAINRVVLFERDGRAYLRAIGNWDPMPWYVRLSYRLEGSDAQRAFWGFETPEHSMLRQFARAAARRRRARGEQPIDPIHPPPPDT